MSTAIVKHEEQPALPAKWYEPTDFSSGWKLAQVLANSGIVPKEFAGKPESVFAAAAFGAEVGLSVMQSLRMVNVINGKPGLGADGMVAVCLSHRDVCAYFREVETTDDHSTWETQRVGSPAPQTYTFRMTEAVAAGWTSRNPNWKSQPQRMLRARAKSFLARDVYPDLVGGIYDPQELRDAELSDRAERPLPAQTRPVQPAPITVDATVETAPPPSTAAPATPQESAPPPAPAADPVLRGKPVSEHTLDDLKDMEDTLLDAQKKRALSAERLAQLAAIQKRIRSLEDAIPADTTDAQIEDAFGGVE